MYGRFHFTRLLQVTGLCMRGSILLDYFRLLGCVWEVPFYSITSGYWVVYGGLILLDYFRLLGCVWEVPFYSITSGYWVVYGRFHFTRLLQVTGLCMGGSILLDYFRLLGCV